MKFQQRCVGCNKMLILSKEDIKPLTDKDEKYIQSNNKIIDDVNNEKKKNFWGQTVNKHNNWSIYMMNRLKIKNCVGSIKCVACRQEQYLCDNEVD